MPLFDSLIHRSGPTGWLIVALVIATPLVGLALGLIVAFGRRVGRWFLKLAESPRSETHPIWIGIWLLAQLFNILPGFLRWLALAFAALVRYAPALAWLLLPLLVAGLGAIGRLRDHGVAVQGIETVMLPERNGFVHAGLAIGAEEAAVGLQLAGGMLAVLALFAALGHFVAAGRAPTRKVPTLIALALTIVASLATAALALMADASYLGSLGAWPLPLAVLAGGLGVTLASVRDPEESAEAQDAGRGRAFVAVCAVLAVLGTWLGMRLDAWGELHKAISWDAEPAGIARVLDLLPGPTAAGLTALLATLALLVVAVARRPGPGPAVGVTVSSVVVGLGLALVVALHLVAAAGVSSVATHTEEPALIDLLERAGQLPKGGERGAVPTVQGFDEAFAFSDGGWKQVAVFDRSDWDETPRTLLAAMPGDAKSAHLLDAPWLQAEAARPETAVVDLLVEGTSPVPQHDHPGVRVAAAQTVRFHLHRPGEPEGPGTEEEPGLYDPEEDSWAYLTGDPTEMSLVWFADEPLPIRPDDWERALGLHPSGRPPEQLVFVVPGSWSAQDLVTACLQIQAAWKDREDPVTCGLASELPERKKPEPRPTPRRETRRSPPSTPSSGDLRGRVGTGNIDGTSDPSYGSFVGRTMKKYLGRVRQCYERELRNQPNLAGKVSVGFVIAGGTGTVSDVFVESNTTGSADLGRCIKKVVQRIRFNPPPEDEVEVFGYPFVLAVQ